MRRREALRLLASTAVASALARPTPAAPTVRIAVLEPSGEPWVRETMVRSLAAAGLGRVLDPDLVDAAARGAGHAGSLNLTLDDARRLALVAGSDALVLSYGSLVERESDNPSTRWDGFVGLFLVDGRSGRLVRHRSIARFGERAAGTRTELERAVLEETRDWAADLERIAETERDEPPRLPVALDLVARPDPPPGAIPPRFFRRPTPGFTDEADRAHVVATVDLVVDFRADGSFGPIEVVRWAGFGLDEAARAAVAAATFYPARLGEEPVSARGLLRFNFRFRDR